MTAATGQHMARSGRTTRRVFRHTGLWWTSAIIVLGTAVSWFRLPAGARDTLWAEDARDFLGNALADGPVAPLFHPYAGYLHTVPRLVAGLTVSLIPVHAWALAMTAGSCFITACVAALVFLCSRDIVPHRAARLALAAVTLLTPTSPREVLGDTANLHWYLLWLAPWLLLYRPRSRVESWILAAAGLLSTLTEIQMILFAPLLLWRWRDKRRIPVRALYLAGISLQVTATLLAPRKASTALPNSWASIAYGYLINSVMTVWIPGYKNIGHLLVLFGPAAALACAVPFAAAIAWVMVFGSNGKRLMVGVLAASSLAVFVIAIHTSPGSYYDYAVASPSSLANPWITRYGVVPSMDLLATIVLAFTVHPQLRPRPQPQRSVFPARWRMAPRAVIGGVLIVVVLIQFVPSSTRRGAGPEFAPQVAAATHYCRTRPAATPITFSSPPGRGSWKIHASCALFDSRSP
jgi:hypothetical protein